VWWGFIFGRMGGEVGCEVKAWGGVGVGGMRPEAVGRT